MGMQSLFITAQMGENRILDFPLPQFFMGSHCTFTDFGAIFQYTFFFFWRKILNGIETLRAKKKQTIYSYPL